MDLPELNLTTIQAILDGDLDDETVNHLALQSLGFEYEPIQGKWQSEHADPAWKSDHIPHFIANRPDGVKLTRSIPPEDKQLLKAQLGFSGYKVHELTPQKTRRATVANWLLGVLKRQQAGSI
ncbi:MAG: DUF1823 family protein [Synechococcaceae cyanobacterium SM2_3_1]|nr:DUF1823 family protein [Synechococcaceae cyanobacterium SM2_3_1]